MLNILVIEDEKPAATRLIRLLEKYFPDANFHSDLDSIKSAVKWFETHDEPDLIFLDIQLADGLSFEIFKSIKTAAPVVFCTAYDQYAIKAFELNSIDYLLKPVDPEDMEKAVQKFKTLQRAEKTPSIDFNELQKLIGGQQEYKERFVVKIGDKIKAIPSHEISLFYSENKATYAQIENGKSYLIDYSLDQLVDLLNPKKYYRLNRKYIASFQSIEDIRSYSNSRLKLKLKNCDDNDILMSREKVADFKSWLDQ